MNAMQKQAARKFVECWTFRRGSEKGEDQQFWNSLLGEVLGMEDIASRVQYQVPVPMKGTTKFLDAWIPETRVLIEHKSRGVNLDVPQAGHDGLTPYEQAVEYDNARPFDEKARWIVTCNFDEFRIYDRAKPLASPLTLKLGNLQKEAYRLAFLVNPKEKAIDRELEISVQAGRIVAEIYDALLGQYDNCGNAELCKHPLANAELLSSPTMDNSAIPQSHNSTIPQSSILAALNRLCVRLVFCLYAEDADIFPKDCFRRLLEATPAPFLRERLKKLFEILDTPLDKRDVYLEPELCAFPYTNGGLFRNAAESDIPPLTDAIRQLLIGASQFDWRDITPTIFGALFESTLNPVTRRSGGMVYTSVENIHKVIDPLFLGALTRRVNECIAMPPSPSRTRRLLALQEEIASKTFLDPACGSGNFLTETYLSFRRLENRIIAVLQQGQSEFDLGVTIKVTLAQFFGIEINDFAVRVARIALWIAEAQMRRETAEILHREPDYLPLKDYDNIIEGNALRIDWGEILTQRRRGTESGDVYVIGNPPFSGARWMGKEQKADVLDVFGMDWQGVGDLDYVCCWYKKAMDLMGGSRSRATAGRAACPQAAEDAQKRVPPVRCAFVSTNSVCQGGAVANLWKPLFAQGLEIDFAHRTFRWDNEAFDKAHVHCVIVGFHATGGTGVSPVQNGRDGRSPSKTIFDNCRAIPAAHINGYLMDAPDVFIESRTTPLCDVPQMGIGNKPIDGGNYLFTKEEMDAFLKKEPQSARYFRPWYGADEFLYSSPRYCLWLGDCSPTELFALPECLKRVQAVRDYRLASKSPGTRKLADNPTHFHVENFPKGNYIVIPEVSSEKRPYIPIGYLSPDVMCSNRVKISEGASLFHFGILTSSVHNVWVRAVCGRLETRFIYSVNIVYNNFPWPEGAGDQGGDIRQSATDDRGDDRQVGCRSGRRSSNVQKIAATAQSILDARAKYPDATLAQMYGDKMYLFPDLRAAHEANDRAVLAAYGLEPDTSEPEIVAHLFKLYAEKEVKK